MQISEPVQLLIRSITDKYEVAEIRLKNFEDTTGQGIVVASLNELRYVGNHVLRALQFDDEEQQLEQLRRAERHCQRATYDVCAAAMSELFFKFQRFQEYYVASEYHKHVIAVIPDYNQHLEKYRDAQKIIKEVGLNGGKEEYYEQLDQLLPPIREYVDIIYEEYIPRIQVLIDIENSKGKKEKKQYLVMLGVTVVSVIVALIALFKD